MGAGERRESTIITSASSESSRGVSCGTEGLWSAVVLEPYLLSVEVGSEAGLFSDFIFLHRAAMRCE